jgi:monovalent cation/proton antiporter MnhG/PhaG subunit
MTFEDVVVGILRAIGVALELVFCVGVLVARDTLDRLHYAAAAATVGPVLLGAAILVDERLSAAGVSTIVTVGFVVLLSPVLTIATARAAHPRWQGRTLRLAADEDDE